MLTKGLGYYADAGAVRLPHLDGWKGSQFINGKTAEYGLSRMITLRRDEPSGANCRSVWNDISPEPHGGAHYATFPSDLPRICIQASTSERGVCPECGSQGARVIDLGPQGTYGEAGNPQGIERSKMAWGDDHPTHNPRWHNTNTTLGWRPTCICDAGNPVPAVVLDCFAGTATTCLAAQRLGRRAVGVDLSIPYLQQAVKRLEAVTLPMALP